MGIHLLESPIPEVALALSHHTTPRVVPYGLAISSLNEVRRSRGHLNVGNLVVSMMLSWASAHFIGNLVVSMTLSWASFNFMKLVRALIHPINLH